MRAGGDSTLTSVELLNIAAEAARAGGAILQSALGSERDITWKTDEAGEQSVVTDADRRADGAIQALLQAAVPGHGILSEEGSMPDTSNDHLWVIDPLDGTDEFSRGSPSCCVAVAYLWRGTPVIGAVFDPFRDELFTGLRGHGAWLNDRPIRVSAIDAVDEAVIAFSSPDRRRSEASYLEHREVLDALLGNVRQVRIYGSTALEICWTACGRLEAKVSLRGRAWDFLAAAVVLEEAGGICRDLDGLPLTLATIGAVASNGLVHRSLEDVIVGSRAGG